MGLAAMPEGFEIPGRASTDKPLVPMDEHLSVSLQNALRAREHGQRMLNAANESIDRAHIQLAALGVEFIMIEGEPYYIPPIEPIVE